MLKIENISTGYGKKQVLFDISFEIKKGGVVLLTGGNGSGKSTLLKTIFGILPIWNKGKVLFDEENITGKPPASLLKKGLLYIPQKNNLFEDLTVKENLEMAGLTLKNKKNLQQKIDNILSVFTSLVPHLQRIPMKLSGGERQLLTLAMASLHLPKMILCDEPLTGLSPQNINKVVQGLCRLNNEDKVTLLISEHRIKEILTFANKVIGLKFGSIAIEAKTNQNFNIGQLEEVYL
jgi:ABC-type branched-subunit amino acid transport system ATPase component